jgi:DNA-binding winged helix-turn-helix (wHTH) protein
MSVSAVRFGTFRLDPANRSLARDGARVELNARYLDVLILLVDAGGELVTKDRFMAEVWRGIPVTDEALTQAIRTLRRTLGDSAAAPRFIETVPKHGYRFIAPVEIADAGVSEVASPTAHASSALFMRRTLTATWGAMLAGVLVGLIYGFSGAAQPGAGGGGAVSLLLVLALVATFSAGVAGAGIGMGLAAARLVHPARWYSLVAGGAIGGVTLGALANLLGSDAFRLLFGQDVGKFAGATEGFVLGSVVGAAAFLADRRPGPALWPALGIAALLGAGAGLAIALLDGRMMAGSLESLVKAFPSSQFPMAAIGGVSGERGLGPVVRFLTCAFEGAVFCVCVVWRLHFARSDPSAADYSSEVATGVSRCGAS